MSDNGIATGTGYYHSPDDIRRVCSDIESSLGGKPDLVIASYTAHSPTDDIAAALEQAFPATAIMGSSSCRGVLTNHGLSEFQQPGFALWAMKDDDGDFGCGFSDFGDDVHGAVEQALDAAIEQADRDGEIPDLVWVHSAPGQEECVVGTLNDLLDGDVLIVGGSSADEDLSAKWSCFASTASSANGVAVAVFYTSFHVSSSFENGYIPTESVGIATRTEGRVVYEIDHQPAARVYNQWVNGLVDLEAQPLPVHVLGTSTLQPIGVAVGDVGGIPYYNLAHPETYTVDEALSFFCDIREGEQLTLMQGTQDNIISRPGRVANEATNALTTSESAELELVGGLFIFCGGCLLAVEDRAAEIKDHIQPTMGQAPFLCAFTFGEQGRFVGGQNRHGNLMISATLFHKAV